MELPTRRDVADDHALKLIDEVFVCLRLSGKIVFEALGGEPFTFLDHHDTEVLAARACLARAVSPSCCLPLLQCAAHEMRVVWGAQKRNYHT